MQRAKVIPIPDCQQFTPVKHSPAMLDAAEPQEGTVQQRVREILSNTKPALPQSEVVTALHTIDSKLDQVIGLLCQKGGI